MQADSGRAWPLALLTLVLASAPLNAAKDSEAPLQLRLTQALVRDNNLQRTPGPGAIRDQIWTSTGALQLKLQRDLHRLEIQAKLQHRRLQQTTALNQTTADLRAEWRAPWTQDWSSRVALTRREAPTDPSDDPRLTRSNLRTHQDAQAELRRRLDGRWSLTLDTRWQHSRLSTPEPGSGDQQSRGLGVVAERDLGDERWLEFGLRRTTGHYTDLVGIEAAPFRERQVWSRWRGSLAGHTEAAATLGHQTRHHPGDPGSDFSGWVGNLDLQWRPSAKTSVKLGVQQALDRFYDRDQRAVSTRSVRVAPQWAITPHTAVTLSWERGDALYQSALLEGPARRDQTTRSGLGLDWSMSPQWTLGASLRQQRRSSNLPGIDHRIHLFGLELTHHP